MVEITNTKFVSGAKKRRKMKFDLEDKIEASCKKGVILLSHIPRGFYEHQMLGFFSQFGEVTRLKLIRSRKTGGSRNFAFIEFRYEEVAKIAAETMNFYLMFRKVLRCKFIPIEDIKKSTFYRWKEIYVAPNNKRRKIDAYNKAICDPNKVELRKKRSLQKREALQKKLQEMGIDYDVMNVKRNESFIPPRRSRATLADIEKLRLNRKVSKIDGRSSDFDYSDDEEDKARARRVVVPPKSSAASKDDLDETAESQDQEVTDDFSVMVVDSEEDEITFKTPPPDARIRRMALKKSREMRNKRKTALLKLQQSLDSDTYET